MKRNEQQSLPFGITPAEVTMDNRLTLETMRVLVALFSFRNKVTGLAWPSREELSVRCGNMHPSNISDATAKLVELGWLVKEGKGGFSKSTRYTITVPEEVTAMEKVFIEKSEQRKRLRNAKVADAAIVASATTVAAEAISGTVQKTTPASSPTNDSLGVVAGTTRIEQTNGTDQLGTDQGTGLLAPDKSGAPEEEISPSTQVWEAYNTAYFNRYGTDTIRDALANKSISRLIDCVGKKEAPHIAAFYLSINKQYYITRYHDLETLVKDAKGIRTQWVTGRTMTNTRAAQLDSTATNADAVKEAMEIWKRRNGHANV